MLFTNVFTYTVALAAALPMVLGQDSSPFHPKYAWDEDLKVFKLGSIPSRSTKNPNRAADWLGRCHEGQVSRGSDIGLGDYGCGESKNLGTAIYKCVKDKKTGEPWLKRQEVCRYARSAHMGGGQCVRNQLRKGRKFYPSVDGNKVVCVNYPDVYGHSE